MKNWALQRRAHFRAGSRRTDKIKIWILRKDLKAAVLGHHYAWDEIQSAAGGRSAAQTNGIRQIKRVNRL